jgi:signal transduction histidine kinase
MNKEKKAFILVVDDDASVLDATSVLLEEHGYHVTASSNAGEAIEILQLKNIEIVLTDIVMPEISGIELIRAIHDINPNIPVILMTAYADIEKVITALKIGAFDFITKPYSAQLLIHSIERAYSYSRIVQKEEDYKHLLEDYSQEIETLVAERTMGLMALTLADRIRNPSTVIGMTCKRLLEKEDVSDKVRSKLDNIMGETKKLDAIVRDFESLLHNKKSMFRYEDINTVIEDAIIVSENKFKQINLKIAFKPWAAPLKVNMQKHLLQIALSNLLKNARDAIADGGNITIATYEEGSNAMLDILDTGYGINDDDIRKIFDPIFSTKEKRFGMGLPLVKRIISEHMGDIYVESKLGKGTLFRIRLPLRWTEGSKAT